jgi:hypothetical protein
MEHEICKLVARMAWKKLSYSQWKTLLYADQRRKLMKALNQ